MSNKYIIKNCPCLDNSGVCQRCKNWGIESCQDCTDCVIKQIVEKCKIRTEMAKGSHDIWDDAIGDFTREILQLLDIQEAE